MQPAIARSTLMVSSCIDLTDPSGTWWRVAVVRTGEWDGSAAARDYVLMWLFCRAWRWVRRVHTWDVAVGRSPSLWHRRHKIVATFPSRVLAAKYAIEIVGHIEAGTSW